jgi:hypothetical protein
VTAAESKSFQLCDQIFRHVRNELRAFYTIAMSGPRRRILVFATRVHPESRSEALLSNRGEAKAVLQTAGAEGKRLRRSSGYGFGSAPNEVSKQYQEVETKVTFLVGTYWR